MPIQKRLILDGGQAYPCRLNIPMVQVGGWGASTAASFLTVVNRSHDWPFQCPGDVAILRNSFSPGAGDADEDAAPPKRQLLGRLWGGNDFILPTSKLARKNAAELTDDVAVDEPLHAPLLDPDAADDASAAVADMQVVIKPRPFYSPMDRSA